MLAPVKFTYEDFLPFPGDGKRNELLGGKEGISPGGKKETAVN